MGGIFLFLKYRNVALESLTFEPKFDRKLRKRQEHRIKGAPGEAKIGPSGAPQSFRKPGRQKDILGPERGKQMAPKWEPQFESLAYFR